MKKYIFLFSLIFLLTLPVFVFAQDLNLDYPIFTINGQDVTLSLDMPLDELVAWFYYFIIAIAGLAVFIKFVIGGVKWLTSAGDPAKVGDAQDDIKSALFGLFIILLSYLILEIINPELLTLREPTQFSP